jgi:Tfp pilus assembly protein PilF
MGSPGMGNLFQVSARIAIPDVAADLAEAADVLYEQGNYAEALAKYEEASLAGGGQHVELLHRKGRCHARLARWAEAKRLLARALRLDPNNKEIRRDYRKAKRKARKR